MAYTAVPTENPGDVLTSTLWNTYVRDNLNSGVMRMLADTTLGGSAASVDLTSIPATFAHLMLLITSRSDTAALNAALQFRFNGDTGTNYYDSELYTSGVSATSGEDLAQSIGTLGTVPGSTANANLFGSAVVFIPGYVSTTPFKNFLSLATAMWQVTTGNHRTWMSGGTWQSTAAINRVTVLLSAGNLIAGSRVTLYGLPA